MKTPNSSPKPPVVETKQHVIARKWNKFIRLLKYFVLSCIILTILEVGVAYWLLSSRWHLLLSKEEMIELASEVDKAPPLPANFMRVYTANFPRHLNTTLTQQIFVNYGSRFFLRQTEIDKKPHCFCDMVYDIQKKKHKILDDLEWDGRLQDLEYGFGVEKYTTPDKCFYYVTAHWLADLRNRLNPAQYGHIKEKPIESLTDDELIELILLLKNKNRFSRYQNPERFQKAFLDFKAKLAGSTTAND